MSSRLNRVGVQNARHATLSRRGGCLALLSDKAGIVTYAEPTGRDRYPDLRVKAEQVLLRSFCVRKPDGTLRRTTELMYTVAGESSTLFRRNLEHQQQMVEVSTRLDQVTCLVDSHDGRYVAVGDTHGDVQVWNFDFATPVLICHLARPDLGAVQAMSFKRTNTELFVSFSNGEYFVVQPFNNDSHPINNDANWACYSIDTQSDGNGVVFAGDHKRVWFLRTPTRSPHINLVEECPFGLQVVKSITGKSMLQVAAMPHASLEHLDTGIGPFIDHAMFLSDSELMVANKDGAELWDLDARVVLEEVQFKQQRLIGCGRHENDAYLMLV